MADYERGGDRFRPGGGGGGPSRKRRFQRDDEDFDRRGYKNRRIDTRPPHIRVRQRLLAIAENPMLAWHDEVASIANLFTDNWEDELLRKNFVDLVLQLSLEQPLKIPFLAAVVLVANTNQPEIVDRLLVKLTGCIETKMAEGDWRDVKLYLKLLACLSGALEGDGIFPLLEELFSKAAELQTASSDDTIGMELVKIILLTLPYAMVTDRTKWTPQAAALMDQTEILAMEPHALQTLIEPYHTEITEENTNPSASLTKLLQTQLQAEATNGWPLTFLPEPWKFPVEDLEQQTKLANAVKHKLPTITIPSTLPAGPRPLFPDVYFSVYSGQEVESVPSESTAASSLIRDALTDTIGILHFNRNVTARHLIEVDCFFAPRTFAARATPFDRLRDIEAPKSTWKPEDVAVDAVFSQLFQLPSPEHKLVYYHAVLTEACKLAPAAIAPSLGRAIRYLYRNIVRLDLELNNRFLDWFSHHLSNFGFTWKWTEWVDDVALTDLHPQKAFIKGAIDKEIRLSFAQRIKNTLPEPYKHLLSAEMEEEFPEFKFKDDATPFAAEGREIAALLRKKADDDEMQPVIERIHALALDNNLDPLVASTDVFVTAVLHVGSKSLSHVLAAIERTKDRLTDAGAASDAARSQIISAVMTFWSGHPGVALCIIEKLLNYSILVPSAVIHWALVTHAGATRGDALARAHVYELVFTTVVKVTNRVRQVVRKTDAAADVAEVAAMRELFAAMDDALASWADGSKDEQAEMDVDDGEGRSEREALVKRWGQQWLRVFRRRAAIEEAFLAEEAKEARRVAAAAAGGAMEA